MIGTHIIITKIGYTSYFDADNADKKPEAGWSTPSLRSPPPWQPGCGPATGVIIIIIVVIISIIISIVISIIMNFATIVTFVIIIDNELRKETNPKAGE